MAVPITNVGMDSIQTEFGGTNPISMDEYYAGGANVPSGTQSPVDPSPVPTSGAITIGEFRGCSKVTFPPNGGGISTTASNSPGFTTNVFANLHADGTITYGGGGTGGGTIITHSTYTSWATPSGGANDYSSIYTLYVTSVVHAGGGGSWNPTTTGPNGPGGTFSGTCGPGQSNTVDYTVEVRKVSDSSVVANFTVSLNMDNT